VKAELEDHAFESTWRHGKYLLIRLDTGKWLSLHFAMTGWLKYFKNLEKRPSHQRLLIDFSAGYHLAYGSQRKLGKVELLEDVERFIEEKGLGPDVLQFSFDFGTFLEGLAGRRSMIKSALMNQHIMAGIGNIYSFQGRNSSQD